MLLMGGGPQGGGPDMGFLLMMGALLVVMYFFMIRPQSKKAKEQKNFIEELKKGDKVVTIGGIHGKILKVDEGSFLVEIDTNTKIRLDKASVSVESTQAASKKVDKVEKADS